MKKNDITILTLWDGVEVTVKKSLQEFNAMQDEDIENGFKTFVIKELQEEYSYSDIKRKKGKSQYLELPTARKTPLRLSEMSMTEQNTLKTDNPELYYSLETKEAEEREAKAKVLKEIYNKTYESRRKKFIEKRKDILEDLAKKEKEYGLDTTKEKLEKLELYIKKDLGHLREGKQLES